VNVVGAVAISPPVSHEIARVVEQIETTGSAAIASASVAIDHMFAQQFVDTYRLFMNRQCRTC
jgi:uncharacterized membrane protein